MISKELREAFKMNVMLHYGIGDDEPHRALINGEVVIGETRLMKSAEKVRLEHLTQADTVQAFERGQEVEFLVVPCNVSDGKPNGEPTMGERLTVTQVKEVEDWNGTITKQVFMEKK